MQTWNEKLRDEVFLEDYRGHYPEAFLSKSYLFQGVELKTGLACSAGKNCLVGATGGKGEERLREDERGNKIKQIFNCSWVFCFACNRLYHLLCQGLRTQAFLEWELKEPFRCKACQSDPNNSEAREFYSTRDNIDLRIKKRRELFIVVDLSETDGTEDSYVVEPHDKKEAQQGDLVDKDKNIEHLLARCEKAESKLAEYMEEIREFKRMKEEFLMMRARMSGSSTIHASDRDRIEAGGSSSSTRRETTPPRQQEQVRFSTSTPPKQRKSFIEDIDIEELTRSERITLEQAQAQMHATEAQREIASSQSLTLTRKALPKITKFNGDPKKWIQFKRDVVRYRDVGRYDEYEMRMHVLQALEGLALSRVQGSIDKVPFENTMNALQKCFGEPTRIIEKCGRDILDVKLPRDLCKDDVLLISSKIQEYFAACQYAEVECANSNQLAMHIFNQLSVLHKQLFRQRSRHENPGHAFRLIDLESLFGFLEDLADDLEDKKIEDKKYEERKPKPVQINANAMMKPSNSFYSKPKHPDDFMFEIKDKNVSPHGYDLKALSRFNKFCDCCMTSGHYTLQCRKYRAMSPSERLRFVHEKNVCRNCIITSTHRSFDCYLKDVCGFREHNEKCSRKHHITIHKAFNSNDSNTPNYNKGSGNGNGSGGAGNGRSGRPFRRNNTNSNQRRAADIENNSKGGNEGGSAPADTEEEITREQNKKDTERALEETAREIINRAPKLCEMPRSQVPGYNAQMRPTVVANTASGCGNAAICGTNDIMSIQRTCQVYSIGTTDIQRTVKVFKNKFFGNNGYVIGYSVGDSAAEVTLVCDELRQILGIQGEKCELNVQWTDGSLKLIEATRIDLVIQGISKNCRKIVLKNCYAYSDFRLPPRSLDMNKLRSQFPYLRDVEYESYTNISPCLLIGSPHASVIESIDKLLEGGEGKPVGLRAKLGWSVYGGCPDECSIIPYNIESICVKSNECANNKERISNEKLYECYSYFCSIESLGIGNKTTHNTEKEQLALDTLKKGMRILADGSIQVPLVWNREDIRLPVIPNNFIMVYKRQVSHEIKLSKNPQHLKAFNDNFKEWLVAGHVRPATSSDLNGSWGNVNYLPMSLTSNPNKDPPKFRNVFDASARYQGSSLNAHLLKGPDLLVDLTKPLLRMRENEVAFTADIKNMFMQIKICWRDQQVQRVIWRENVNEEFRVFVFTSMLFGPTSSPFTSQFVKNKTAERFMNEFPKAAETIVNFMYMDDLLTSEKSLQEAITVAKQCIEIFDSINWKLISFQSNSVDFLKALPEANISQETIPLLESDVESCMTKVLGCVWDTKNDAFVFKFDKNLFIKIVRECQHRPTKRDQCSTIARIFDVLGLISPFTIRGKILLQRSWLAGIGWDEEISEKDHKDWMVWLNEIENVAKIKIQRRYNLIRNLSECDSVELHTFADAGGEAFAAVSYIVTSVRNKRYSNIVMAKAKVTPIRHKSRTQISEMPRLELCACLIASRLAHTITKHYPNITFKRYFWTDSEVVLRWIVKPNHKLLKYAISPIEEILDKTTRNEWRYVPTKLNVADIATKFQKFDFADSNSVWYKGPGFLRSGESQWPAMPSLLEPPVVHEQVMVNVVNVNCLQPISTHKLPPIDCPLMSDCMIEKFSASIRYRWLKLVRATARALKIIMNGFIPLLKSKQYRNKKVRGRIKAMNDKFRTLSPTDIERAEHFLIRKAQRDVYDKEYKCLRLNRPLDNTELKQLNVFLDSEGLIRINSRVALGSETYPQRYAPLVPRRHPITRAFLMFVHEEYRHMHLESQIAAIRSKYWIPQLRAALKSIQASCNYCSLLRAKPYIPRMAPLPDCRTDPTRLPFETTGVDCMGPFMIMNYNRPKKVWVLIFSCTLTRFIHLRILYSLESIQVLEAIVEFWACHGPVKTFISDRGTNFVGASNIIEEDRRAMMNFLQIQHMALSQQLVEKYSVEWLLLPAHSPWMGAFYERMIREVKRSIAPVLDNRKLNAATLNIALNDAAHRINNRPLTHNSVSAEDEPILTPHLLAKGRSGWPYLPGLQSSNSNDATKDHSVYRRGRAVADEVMRRFYRNYLPVMTKRVKWNKDEKPLKEGDLVLLIEPNDTRKEWKRGKVVKVYKGRDGRCRVADVMMPDHSIKKSRSVQRLAKIEIKSSDEC